MREGWKEILMDDLIDEISMGPFGSDVKVENFVKVGVPVLNGSNLDGFRLKEDSFRYFTKEKADALGKANASRGDVVVTHRGTIGQIIYVPQNSKYDRYVVSQSQFRFRCNEKVLPEYVVYFFHSRIGRHKLLSNASQVGVPALARATTTFRKLAIPLPPLETQRRIAAVLGALDDKIELNRKMNANLEAQAQALFKSWFVDFEPFGGKMPEGWKKSTLADVCDLITDGSHFSPKEITSGSHKIYSVKDMGEYGFSEDKAKLISKEDYGLLVRNGCVPKEGDVVVAKDGSYMKSIFVVGSEFEGAVLSSIAIFRPNVSKITSSYLLYFLREDGTRNDVKLNYVSGTGVPRIVLKDFKRYQIVVPSMAVIQNADRLLSSLRALIMKNERESRKLAEIRDALLPKLMKGEVEV